MKRRILFLFLSMALCAMPFVVGVSAETEGYYTYTVSNGEASITDMSYSWFGDLTIPPTLGGYPVTSIGAAAFEYHQGIQNVTIPSGVTSIGTSAFKQCPNLTSVTIPNSVTRIGQTAFYLCKNLMSIQIPSGVTSIEYGAFGECTNLTSITIPSSVVSIGSNAFMYCSNLTIYGYAGSTAETYATGNNIPFVDIQALAAAKAEKIAALKALPKAENLIDAAVAAALAEGEAAINAAMTVAEVNALYEVHSAKVLAADAAASEATPTQSVTVNSITPGKKKIEITLQNLPNVQQMSFYAADASGLFKELVATVDVSTLTVTDASGQAIGTCEIGTTTNDTQVFTLTSSDAQVDSLGVWYPILVAWDNYGVSIQTAESIFSQVITVGALARPDPEDEAAAALAKAKAEKIAALKALPKAENLTDSAVAAALSEAEAAINAAMTVAEVNALYEVHSVKVKAADEAAIEATPTQGVTVNSIMPGKKIEITLQNIPDVQEIIFYYATEENTFKYQATVDISSLSVTRESNQKIGTCEIGATTNDTQVFTITSSDNYVDAFGNWCPILVAGQDYGVRILTAESIFGQIITVGELAVTEPDPEDEAAAALAKAKAEKIAALKALPKAANLTDAAVAAALAEGEAAIQAAQTIAEVNALYEVHSAKVRAADAAASYVTTIIASGTCGADGDNLTWELTEDGTLTISGEGEMADWSGGYKAPPWDNFDKSIVKVVIETGVTYIGKSAFNGCSSLTNVTIPNSVVSIGEYAFYICTSLREVTIPESVDSIGNYAFQGCTNLTTVSMPAGVSTIGRSAFNNCSALTAITIPVSCNSIEPYTFHGCTSLTGILIPQNIATIGDSAFENCTNLTSVYISEGITSIGSQAFYNCASLAKIIIPTSVTSIGYSAFEGCTSLASAEIKSLTTTLGRNVFNSTAENFLIAAYTDSTAAAYSIHNNIPFARLNTSHLGAFSGTVTQTFDSTNGKWVTYLNIRGNGEMPNYGGTNAAPWYGYGNGVVYIGNESDSGFGQVDVSNILLSDMRISFSNSITSVGKYAFSHSDGLNLALPASVTSIADYAFYHGDGMTITIPSSVTSIGQNAFAESTNLTIYGYAGSAAETYAITNNIPFEAFNTIASAEWTPGFGRLNINLANINATESIQLTLKSTTGDPLTTMRMNVADFTITDNNAYVWSYVDENWYFMTANGSYPISQYFSVTGRARPTVGVLSHCGSIIDGTCTFSAETGWTISSDVLSGFFPFSSAKMSCQLYSIPGGIGISFPEGGWARTAWTPSKDVVPASLELTVDGKVTKTLALAVNAEEWKQSFTTIAPTVNLPSTTESNITLTAPVGGWKNGTNTFSVKADLACAVVVSYDGGQTYTRLTATANTDGSYRFTAANVTAETIVAAIPMGDANGDGKITNADITRMKAANLGKISFDSLYTILTDVNGDGKISNADITRMKAVNLGKTALGWN